MTRHTKTVAKATVQQTCRICHFTPIPLFVTNFLILHLCKFGIESEYLEYSDSIDGL